MSKVMNIYGTVVGVKASGDFVFAKVQDGNDKTGEGHFVLCSNGKDNKFGTNNLSLKVGQKLKCTGKALPNKTYGVTSQVTVYGGKKKSNKNTGIETGHAINAAYILTKYSKVDVSEEAQEIHDITVELKEEVAASTGESIDSYALGASVGHAVLNACRMSDSTREIKELAKDILSGPVAKVYKYIEG